MKRFNTTGTCYPDEHYMVNLESRLKQIKEMVDYGDYFVINRARQFGKTTTLRALREYLKEEYIVISLSFQALDSDSFKDNETFSTSFMDVFIENIYTNNIAGLNADILNGIESKEKFNMMELFKSIKRLCATAQKPMVLMIDEVDVASNNQVFIDFLAQLRNLYLTRKDVPTFHSVILAGVHDIKNLKSKIRPEETHKYNSPWNIAVEFGIDMSFSPEDIESMLVDYINEHKVEMDMSKISNLIYDYTSGYPFLVSRICQIIDEKLSKRDWTEAGVREAVQILLKEDNTLFQDMIKKIDDYPELQKMLQNILMGGKSYTYNLGVYEMALAAMYGFIRSEEGKVAISNRIFETYLYDLFIDKERIYNEIFDIGIADKNQFIKNGYLNMSLVLEKFVQHYNDIYGKNDGKFLEDNARKLFLLYLRPIINGVGNYYIEARTRDMKRTDIIVDYKSKQYVIEMKIWHGDEYNKRGEKQLLDYLDFYHLDKGYLLSFNFNKNKQIGVKEIKVGEKTLIEAIA